MADRFFGRRNLAFLLYEVFDAASLTGYEYYSDHDRGTFDLTLDTAERIATEILFPVLAEVDQQQPEFVDGEVKVHPVIKQFMDTAGEGGWICAGSPYEVGGQQLPFMMTSAVRFIFMAANYSACIFAVLTSGAGRLIESFGSPELVETYLTRMYAGEWQGTMALTEPQAGSSLADVKTEASPTDQGYYLIRGQKMFISASEYDSVENIVHLLLARIKGAPPGVKGISLFVVPKKRPQEDGGLVPNDVTCLTLYHKLGYRGSPITQLSFGEAGDCRGYLVGEPHAGLTYMFQMMNEARLDVGMGATGMASAAYYASLQYAKERPQGRKPGTKDPTRPQVPIIEHADVRRMLLLERAVVEGSLGLILQCARYADLEKVAGGEAGERASLLLGLLTPVAKSYPSEMGIVAVSQGLQILGGYGYCDEFPLQQYYRDMRIHPIHEGTTGIHAITLLGRNVRQKQGQAFQAFGEEVRQAISAAAEVADAAPYAERLAAALRTLEDVTSVLLGSVGSVGEDVFLADANLYLELFGIVAIGWQWLLQATASRRALGTTLSAADAKFYRGKWLTMQYFFHYELPKVESLASRLRETDGLTVKLEQDWFDD
jgi:alkylation response protein AidB-like acyl-CoA dehydrogenase